MYRKHECIESLGIWVEEPRVPTWGWRPGPGQGPRQLEKSINALKNLLIRQRVEIITADDDLVHVSGHGYAEEIKQIYNWTKPYISIPVHGENMHLTSHKKLKVFFKIHVICYNGGPLEPLRQTELAKLAMFDSFGLT